MSVKEDVLGRVWIDLEKTADQTLEEISERLWLEMQETHTMMMGEIKRLRAVA